MHIFTHKILSDVLGRGQQNNIICIFFLKANLHITSVHDNSQSTNITMNPFVQLIYANK
jgi:hypothetical protein